MKFFTTSTLNSKKFNTLLILLVFSFTLFLFLLFSSFGTGPAIMGDEYLHSILSRHLPFAESPIPNYLYFIIYRLTNVCGNEFFGCARILNAFFFVGSAPFIYLTARRVCKRKVALFLVFLILLSPYNSYTGYFMPEPLYFFLFWLFTWFTLGLDNISSLKNWCVSGTLLGLTALVKPHALFLLPACILYIVYVTKKKTVKCLPHILCNIVFFITFVFFTKFLISYLLAGKAGIVLFGSKYATYTENHFNNLIPLLSAFVKNMKGQILANCLLFSLPIACTIYTSMNTLISREEINQHTKLALYTLLTLLTLMVISSLFTAAVGSVWRLRMRYCNFAFPLLFIVAAAQLSLKTHYARKWKLIVVLPIAATMLWAIYTHLHPYQISFIDEPSLACLFLGSRIFYLLSAISFFSLLLWIYTARLSAKIFLYLLIPLATIFSQHFGYIVKQSLRTLNNFDKAGIFTKQYLDEEGLSKLLVIGANRGYLYRTLFYIDNPQASIRFVPQGTRYDLSSIPTDRIWALIIGDIPISKNTFYQKIAMNDFKLLYLKNTHAIDFKKPAWPGIVSNAQGLSSESWGAWSTGDRVVLKFFRPLPKKFNINLIAKAFGPNVGKEFVALTGNSITKFTLAASPEKKVLKFNNPNRASTLEIQIPSPTSPKKLGFNNDSRTLGIGLIELKIVPLEK